MNEDGRAGRAATGTRGVEPGPGLEAAGLRLFARALDYPDEATDAALARLAEALAATRPQAAAALAEHAAFVRSLTLAERQERYAATFDLNPAVCLYVGYHLWGDSYPRGAFMARLAGTYAAAGFRGAASTAETEDGAGGEPAGPAARELPDHLCVLLRFMAHCAALDPERASACGMDEGPAAFVRELAREATLPAVDAILNGFAGTGHPYAPLLRALRLALGGAGDRSAEGAADPAAKRSVRPLPVLASGSGAVLARGAFGGLVRHDTRSADGEWIR